MFSCFAHAVVFIYNLLPVYLHLCRGLCHEPAIIPVSTKHLYNIYTMLDQRRRRWADVVEILYECFVLSGMTLDKLNISTLTQKCITYTVSRTKKLLLRKLTDVIQFDMQTEARYISPKLVRWYKTEPEMFCDVIKHVKVHFRAIPLLRTLHIDTFFQL